MKVVSWNIHRCIGTDRAYRPDRIIEVLEGLDADLIALQELDSSLRTESGRDPLSEIANSLQLNALMGPTLKRDYGAYGNALLSRQPLFGCEEHDLSYRKFEPRGALCAYVKHAETDLRIVGTHLGLKRWERAFQIDRLLADFTWGNAPITILLGDFNEWLPWSGNNLRLERAFLRNPRLATFPSSWPRFSLDRIFISGLSAAAVSYDVVQTPLTCVASDHLPVIAHIDI
jgi:endonuclease/exonuclease/phosphatase family metal-dependent hydrolase